MFAAVFNGLTGMAGSGFGLNPTLLLGSLVPWFLDKWVIPDKCTDSLVA